MVNGRLVEFVWWMCFFGGLFWFIIMCKELVMKFGLDKFMCNWGYKSF